MGMILEITFWPRRTGTFGLLDGDNFGELLLAAEGAENDGQFLVFRFGFLVDYRFAGFRRFRRNPIAGGRGIPAIGIALGGLGRPFHFGPQAAVRFFGSKLR